jgi:hypothetical protein
MIPRRMPGMERSTATAGAAEAVSAVELIEPRRHCCIASGSSWHPFGLGGTRGRAST